MEQKPDISSSGAAKAEADPAYVNLKVKQQVTFCSPYFPEAIHT
jgi:hypothetical protein